MWKNIVEPDRSQMALRRMRIACWIPRASNKHSGCVILTDFPLQQWLREDTSVLRCTYFVCLVMTGTVSEPGYCSQYSDCTTGCVSDESFGFCHSGTRDFSHIRKAQPVSDVHVASYSVGMLRSASGVRRPRCKSNHSPPSDNLRLSTSGAIPPNPYTFMACLGTTWLYFTSKNCSNMYSFDHKTLMVRNKIVLQSVLLYVYYRLWKTNLTVGCILATGIFVAIATESEVCEWISVAGYTKRNVFCLSL